MWCIYRSFLWTVKTGPSFADAAVGRIDQSTKVLAEGGYEKIFQQSFETGRARGEASKDICMLSIHVFWTSNGNPISVHSKAGIL